MQTCTDCGLEQKPYMFKKNSAVCTCCTRRARQGRPLKKREEPKPTISKSRYGSDDSCQCPKCHRIVPFEGIHPTKGCVLCADLSRCRTMEVALSKAGISVWYAAHWADRKENWARQTDEIKYADGYDNPVDGLDPDDSVKIAFIPLKMGTYNVGKYSWREIRSPFEFLERVPPEYEGMFVCDMCDSLHYMENKRVIKECHWCHHDSFASHVCPDCDLAERISDAKSKVDGEMWAAARVAAEPYRKEAKRLATLEKARAVRASKKAEAAFGASLALISELTNA